jgi:very-short-patch-repair endonuclease
MAIYEHSKFHRICSCTVCKTSLTVQNLERHIESKHKPKAYCLECNQTLFDFKKFCSSSCSAKYNNSKRDYTKFKCGPPKGYKPKHSNPKQIKRKESERPSKICIICSALHKKSGKTCSDICKRKLLSIRANQRIDVGWNPQENRNRSRPSYLERSFENWLLENNVSSYVKNKTFRCDGKIYYGDFFFEDLKILIELDGSQHEQTVDYDLIRDHLILNHYSVRTIRITHKEYMSKTKIEEVKEALGIRTSTT